ncbi:hypothetical protein [Bacillus paralicheniformis]|uniref:hypothetical protein n=1 Tax=Bacillus paralicheniformis TaxID=1648923 RepID=UPI00186B6694
MYLLFKISFPLCTNFKCKLFRSFNQLVISERSKKSRYKWLFSFSIKVWFIVMVVETVGFADFVALAALAALADLMIVAPAGSLDSPGSWPDCFESLEEIDEAVDQLAEYFGEFVDQSAGFAVEIENQIAELAA